MDGTTTNSADIFAQICQERGSYLQPTQAIAETERKLPTIQELWQLLPDRPDKNPTKETVLQSHIRINKLQEHEIGLDSNALEAQKWMVQTVQKLRDAGLQPVNCATLIKIL